MMLHRVNIVRGSSDDAIIKIKSALENYAKQHDVAQIDLYRHNPVSVRVRIINPKFAGMSKSQRHAQAWQYLQELPEETQSDISSLVLLTADELPRSMANLEFEDPSSWEIEEEWTLPN